MTIQTPTVEDFLSQIDLPEPEEDFPDTLDPLESIADSLRQLVGATVEHADEEKYSAALREELNDLEATYDVMRELLEEIESIVKPSTSKLANTVREAINRWRAPEVPTAVEPEVGMREAMTAAHGDPDEPPARDADVEQWREYARGRGVTDDHELDQLNRSQIRTLLGIEHGIEHVQGDVQ